MTTPCGCSICSTGTRQPPVTPVARTGPSIAERMRALDIDTGSVDGDVHAALVKLQGRVAFLEAGLEDLLSYVNGFEVRQKIEALIEPPEAP